MNPPSAQEEFSLTKKSRFLENGLKRRKSVTKRISIKAEHERHEKNFSKHHMYKFIPVAVDAESGSVTCTAERKGATAASAVRRHYTTRAGAATRCEVPRGASEGGTEVRC